MIVVMELLSFITGLLVSYIGYSKLVDYIFIVIYYIAFNKKLGFKEIYESADDEATFKLLKVQIHEVKTYADYLRIHRAAQPSSYKCFRAYFDTLLKIILIRTTPIVCLLAILFWSNWYLYLAGVVTMVIILLAYTRFVKGYCAGYYQRLMIVAVLKSYNNEAKNVLKSN